MLQVVSFNKVFFNNCTFLACLHVFISFVLACATHTRISLCRLHASPPHEDGRLPVVQLRTARSPPPHMISYIFWLTSISYLVSQAKVPDKDASHWIPCYLRSSCSHVKSGFKIKKNHESKVPGKTPGIKIIYTSPSLSCPHADRRWASTFGRPITKGPSTFGPSKYLAHNQNQQSYHTWPITKIMILLVFLASLTSEKIITLIDLREGYSQSCHGSKQQRVANIDHRILHAQIM